MKEEQKVSFIHSISAKIMLLTVLAVVMSVLIVAFRAETGAKKVVGDVSADYILSMAEMGVEIVNNLPQEADAGAYENALADISMEGIDSSYAYLVDTDGTMLYHRGKDRTAGGECCRAWRRCRACQGTGTGE